MSMTREEAIEELERLLSHWDDLENGKRRFRWYSKDAVEVAITALCPVSREQVEKVWPGCRYCKEGIYSDFAYDKMCRSQEGIYCKFCGKPMTDEAVQMVMERLEVLYGQETE